MGLAHYNYYYYNIVIISVKHGDGVTILPGLQDHDFQTWPVCWDDTTGTKGTKNPNLQKTSLSYPSILDLRPLQTHLSCLHAFMTYDNFIVICL